MKLLVNAHRKYTPLFGHGHNDWLQKISEFGFLGVILIFPYLAKLILSYKRSESLLVKIIFLSSFIYLSYSFIDFPSKTPACLVSFSLITCLVLKYSGIKKQYLGQIKFDMNNVDKY